MSNICRLCNNRLISNNTFEHLRNLKLCITCHNYATYDYAGSYCEFFLFNRKSVFVYTAEKESYIHIINYNSKTIEYKLNSFRYGGNRKTILIKNLFYPSCEEDIENYLILL